MRLRSWPHRARDGTEYLRGDAGGKHGNGHVGVRRYPVFSEIGTIDFDGQIARAALHLCGPSQAAPTLLTG